MSELLGDYEAPESGVVELDSRHDSDMEVTMAWRPATNSIEIAVNDSITGEALILAPPAEMALDAFLHPFAYVAGNLALKDTYTLEAIPEAA